MPGWLEPRARAVAGRKGLCGHRRPCSGATVFRTPSGRSDGPSEIQVPDILLQAAVQNFEIIRLRKNGALALATSAPHSAILS